MNLLNKNLLIIITGFVLILDLIFEIISFLKMIPFNNLTYFLSTYQSIWITALLDISFCFILVVLCFFKKYAVFPILLICSIYTSNGIILNLNKVLHYGFIYPIDNLTGIIGIIELILSLLGIFCWMNQFKRFFKEINFKNFGDFFDSLVRLAIWYSHEKPSNQKSRLTKPIILFILTKIKRRFELQLAGAK